MGSLEAAYRRGELLDSRSEIMAVWTAFATEKHTKMECQMKVKELYLPVAEAAQVCECTERTLYQYGAECLLPFYTDLTDYKYLTVTEDLSEPDSTGALKNCYLVEQDDGSVTDGWSYQYPLHGRYRVFEWSIQYYLTDPDMAPLIPLRFFGQNGDDDKKWNQKWNFYGSDAPLLKDSKLYVMTKNLSALGLLPPEEPMSLAGFSDDPRWYQSDLKIAVEAWMNAIEQYGLHDRPKNTIIKWLENNHPEMKPDRVKRLATVVNWSKAPGRAADGEI